MTTTKHLYDRVLPEHLQNVNAPTLMKMWNDTVQEGVLYFPYCQSQLDHRIHALWSAVEGMEGQDVYIASVRVNDDYKVTGIMEPTLVRVKDTPVFDGKTTKSLLYRVNTKTGEHANKPMFSDSTHGRSDLLKNYVLATTKEKCQELLDARFEYHLATCLHYHPENLPAMETKLGMTLSK